VHALEVLKVQRPASCPCFALCHHKKRDSARHPEHFQPRPDCLVHNASLRMPCAAQGELERQDGRDLVTQKSLNFATPPTTLPSVRKPNSGILVLHLHISNRQEASSSRSLSFQPQIF
jgi:hypothetical protein